MLYRALSPAGDYTFGHGASNFLTRTAAIAQAIKTKLTLFKNGFWGDLDDGLPFFEEIAGNPDKAKVDLLYQSRIFSTPGVSSISTFSSSFGVNRTYTMTATVLTTSGETVEVSV